MLILSHTDYKVVLTGSPSERSQSNEFMRELEKMGAEFGANNEMNSTKFTNFDWALQKNNIFNLVGVFGLREAAALIDRLNILIAPDTGPLHIAAAMKTPTIALFGVANPVSSNPNFDTEIHDFIKVEFSAKDDKHGDFSTLMSQISAQEVYEKMEKLL